MADYTKFPLLERGSTFHVPAHLETDVLVPQGTDPSWALAKGIVIQLIPLYPRLNGLLGRIFSRRESDYFQYQEDDQSETQATRVRLRESFPFIDVEVSGWEEVKGIWQPAPGSLNRPTRQYQIHSNGDSKTVEFYSQELANNQHKLPLSHDAFLGGCLVHTMGEFAQHITGEDPYHIVAE